MPLPELNAEQRALLRQVQDRWESAQSEHTRYESRWDYFWKLWHSFTDYKRSWKDARDRDDVVNSAKREWRAELFIPYAYTTVETILPRLLASRPKMLWLPRDEIGKQNTVRARALMDDQQSQTDYELRLTETAKAGLILGLGVQKLSWRTRQGMRNELAPSVTDGQWQVVPSRSPDYQGPDPQDVDPYDFFWDPFGWDMNSVGWAIHRAWRSTSYVMAKIESGQWPNFPGLSEEDLRSMGARERWDSVWAGRRLAANAGSTGSPRGNDIHEVWEFHDGEQMIVVLNRMLPVAHSRNPYWHGRLPFYVYRPTAVNNRFVGKSEPEAIEDLQEEMNTLRSQRRDNATLKLQQTFVYQEGVVDPSDIKFGPGLAIGVNGDPRSLLYPIQVGDIPNSGYSEETAIKADMEMTTGISDTITGADTGAAETATGVQLVQAAANARIAFKTRRLELELIKPMARDWLNLNKQFVTSEQPVRVPDTSEEGYAIQGVGPEDLMGRWDLEPDAGATSPANVPQDRQDAIQLLSIAAHPAVNSRRIVAVALQKMGLDHPDYYLAADTQVPPATLDLIASGLIQQFHLPQGLVQDFIAQALNSARQDEQQPPDADVAGPAQRAWQAQQAQPQQAQPQPQQASPAAANGSTKGRD